MKKKILLVLALILICSSFLFACSSFKLNGGPKASDPVYGNGGSAVVKGDYLYFSNAYLDYKTLKLDDNKYDMNSPQKIYGIYRTKLNDDGVVSVNENGFPSGAELMVPVVAGYSKSGLYICGEYLYYTSPQSKGKEGEVDVATGYMRFEQIKLNGATDTHTILSQAKFTTDCEYNINYIDGTTYITIFQNEKITVIKSKDRNYSEYTLAEGVTSMKTFKQENITGNGSVDEASKYVYYTKKTDEKYFLYRKSFTNGKEEILLNGLTDEIKIESIKNNRVYYMKGSYLYSSSFNGGQERQYTANKFSASDTGSIVKYLILDDTFGGAKDNGILGVYYDGTNYLVSIFNEMGNNTEHISGFGDKTKQVNLKFIKNNVAYFTYLDDTNLYACDLSTNTQQTILTNFDEKVQDEITHFDYDDTRIFYFANVENSNKNLKYLQIAPLKGAYYKENDKNVSRLIGVLDPSDVKNS